MKNIRENLEIKNKTLRKLEELYGLKFATVKFDFNILPDDGLGEYATYVLSNKTADLPSQLKTSSGNIYNHARGRTAKLSQEKMESLIMSPGAKVVWGAEVKWTHDGPNTDCAKKMKGNSKMEFHYTGQLKDARKLMIDYFGKTLGDVVVMTDDEVIKCIDKEFCALQNQGSDEVIILIQHDKMDKLLNDGTIKVLSR